MSVSPTSLFTGFSLVVSDEPVLRDQFYDGNVKTERGELISNPKAVGHFFYILFGCLQELLFSG